MNDRFDDERLGERVRDSVTRNAGRVSTRPDAEDLFARVGARAARQRRSLAALAVVFVAVASLVGYAIGTTNTEVDDSVQTPVAGPSEPSVSTAPADGAEPVNEGPLEHVFTRTVNGITVRVYTTPPTGEPNASPGFVVAEMSNDAAVGIGRLVNCDSGGLVSGTFGGPEGSPVEWVIVQSFDEPSTTGAPVRAQFSSGVADEMVPERGITVLVAPGAGGTALVEGPGGGGVITIGGQTSDQTCPPPPVPATLPPAGSQPADVAAAEAGVRQAYSDVYDNYDPTTTEERVRQALRAAGFTDEQLAAMTVEIGEIRFTDETHAALLFRLTIPGHMDGTQGWRLGYAVFQDGRWTQGQETNCDDLRSINAACP